MRIITFFAILLPPGRFCGPRGGAGGRRVLREEGAADPRRATASSATVRRSRRAGCGSTARAGFVTGGETGALVKPGEPEKSLLVQAIRYDGDIKMPQKGKLADADIATLTRVGEGRRTVAGRCGDRAEDREHVRPARPGEGALVVPAGQATPIPVPRRRETRSTPSCWRSCEQKGLRSPRRPRSASCCAACTSTSSACRRRRRRSRRS